MWSAANNSMLPAADYCARALGSTEVRAYALIEGKIPSEFKVFRDGAIAGY